MAHVVPLSDPREYVGKCEAKDFVAPQTRLSERAAEADVAEHLADVAACPHRPWVKVITQFVGTCHVGDFEATEVRDSWAEAEADVAAHVAEMHEDESQ